MSVPPTFNDQQEHYKSLINLFKYCVTALLTLITLAGGIFGYISFSNGQEMRADIKEQRRELEEKEKEMRQNVLELIKSTREEVRTAREDALEQIGTSKTMATNAARDRIDEVFKAKNIEHFIESEAQTVLEPKIREMINDKVRYLDTVQNNKIKEVINDLKNGDKAQFVDAMLLLDANFNWKLNEEQVATIINIIRRDTIELEHRLYLANILGMRSSSLIREFFKEELLATEKGSKAFYSTALRYVVSPGAKTSINYFDTYIKNSSHKLEDYSNLAVTASASNKYLTIELLNSKSIIDMVYNSAPDRYQDYKSKIIDAIQISITSKELEDTYFFNKK